MPREPFGERLRRLRDETGDTYVLGIVRVGFGLLLLDEAWLATQQLRGAGYFGGYFHQPFVPESLVPSEGVYQAVLVAQWIAALLVVAGRGVRPALLAAAGLLVSTMLWDRLWFHHYRHTMAAFCVLLAFTPCDRHFVAGKAADERPGPLWARNAILAQISVMYLASGGSKLFDPEWRSGQMMHGMIRGFAAMMRVRGVPGALVDAMQSPLGASLLAKGAITTELSLALLLWWPRTRKLAVWMGLVFHLAISQMTPVRLFTIEMLLVYLLWTTPDVRARTVRYDPKHRGLAQVVESLDWLRRFALAPRPGSPFVVVDRDGREKRGLRAAAEVFGALPALFFAWPLVALLARRRAGGSRRE
ncbi:MAG TPA: HTTM domain-containing protein [Polyangiaceae bacterium]